MVKSRSKISRQPVKKSTKTAACSAGARTLGKSQSAKSAARPAPSKTAAKGKWVYTFGGGKAQGRADVRNLLGGKGADPNAPSNDPRSPPALLSVIFGLSQTGYDTREVAKLRLAIMNVLFDAGAKIASLDDLSRTFLFRTPIVSGDLPLVTLLINHGGLGHRQAYRRYANQAC
jgi:hypothetical protein